MGLPFPIWSMLQEGGFKTSRLLLFSRQSKSLTEGQLVSEALKVSDLKDSDAGKCIALTVLLWKEHC